jgi:alpha-D-xyloside xylohydrolase
VIAFLAGCVASGGAPAPEDGGAAWVDAPSGFWWTWNGSSRLRFPVEAFSVGVVPAIDPDASYDPWWEDASVTWHAATSVEALGASSWRLDHGPGGKSTLRRDASANTRAAFSWVPDDPRVALLKVAPRASADEGFYGLGEWFDRPEHRGARRAMQIEFDPTIESLYNEVHVPIPLMVGTEGWGWFVDDAHPSVWDVATTDDEEVAFTVGLGVDAPAGIRFHLFARDAGIDVLKDFHAVSGAPALPAPWAWGPLLWRDENTGQAQFEDDVAQIRALDLAASGVWIDRPYASGVNAFDFEPSAWPDPAGMVQRARDHGLRVAIWHTPYLDPDEVPSLHAEATAGGFFPPIAPPIALNNWGIPIDFSNPESMAWWQEQLGAYVAMGIEGYKLDYGEDVIVGVDGARLPWGFHDGTDERTMHKRYAALYHEAYDGLLPDDGGFLLCRASVAGDQVRARVIWPGDLVADLSRHGDPLDDGVGSVGGLPAAVSAALSTSASGFPLFGSDTGGYKRSPPDDETWRRWFAHTALSSVMQVGNSASVQPWELSDGAWSEASLVEFTAFARLHLRLFPYGWSVLVAGEPLVRPLGLVHPDVGHPGDAYLFGPDLLVAPVVEAGAVDRVVPFPAGRWTDWWTGEVVEGPGEVLVDAPLGALPLYLREGALVAMLRPTVDTLAPVTVDGVESWADEPGALWWRVTSGVGEVALMDGTVATVSEGPPWTFAWEPGDTWVEGGVLEWVGVAAVDVEIDGVAVAQSEDGTVSGWSTDGVRTWVTVPPEGGAVVLW